MSTDQAALAANLFPDLPLDAHAARTTAVAVQAAKPSPAAPVAAVQPVAKAEETLDVAMDRMDKAFGLGKYTPGPDGKTVADREAEAAAGDAKAADAKAVEWIDMSHPDAVAVAPVIADLKLSQEQTAKLETLHQRMNEAAAQRQAAVWVEESERVFAQDRTMLADAKLAIRTYGSAELKAVLNSSGLGNNATVIRAFANAWRSNPINYGTRRY